MRRTCCRARGPGGPASCRGAAGAPRLLLLPPASFTTPGVWGGYSRASRSPSQKKKPQTNVKHQKNPQQPPPKKPQTPRPPKKSPQKRRGKKRGGRGMETQRLLGGDAAGKALPAAGCSGSAGPRPAARGSSGRHGLRGDPRARWAQPPHPAPRKVCPAVTPRRSAPPRWSFGAAISAHRFGDRLSVAIKIKINSY